jgi:hypothetical protein
MQAVPVEDDWVEVVRVHDRFEADIMVGLLDDHGVPVRTSGGANTALPMIGLTDVRILVPRDCVGRAELVLSAMRGGQAERHPFRDGPPEPYEAPRAARRAPFAVMLALLVPFGAGHFYARHTSAGAVIAAGVIGGFVGAYLGAHALVYASVLLVTADALLAPWAVRRCNSGDTPDDGAQRLGATCAVAMAFVLAVIVGT